ncbi:MAG: hypothetical protein K2X93_16585 [Candidatus Obscuribacterales bacterium]|nr:hypothetical protein [Candidatus Obscuribacterales bacterium]
MSQDLTLVAKDSNPVGSHQAFNSRLALLVGGCVFLKVFAMTLFSSGFENELFLPFVRHYLENFDNPWQYFFTHSARGDEFPYQPLMLYIVAFFCAPLKFLGAWDNVMLRNFLFKMPTLLADCAVAWYLFRMRPEPWRYVVWFYFGSLIILYACYMHSQLDLIPTAFLFASFFYLKENKFLKSYILYGLALSTKLHVLAAFPLIVIYLYRNKKFEQVIKFGLVSLAVYAFFVAPYINSGGFQHLVMANPKQGKLLELNVPIGDLKLYLPILATFMAYGRFALYPKINADLLDAFLVLVFCLLVMLIVPAPGWYVWMVPFVGLFLTKYYHKNKQLVLPFLWVNFFYLVFFILFDRLEYVDLVFLDQPVQLKSHSEILRGFAYTVLEVGLLSIIVLCYRAGVRSNSIYKRVRAVVIGIGGDSGAGKSTLLGDVKSLLSDRVVELEGDADHKWERGDEHWQEFTHLDPKANFLHRQAETILSLKHGRPANRVEYDHSTGQFTSPQLVEPNEFVIISGLHTFYLPKMRKLIDFKIFMDTDYSLNARWKLHRDQAERGYTEEQIMRQIESRRPDSDKFIAPQKGFADLVVRYHLKKDFGSAGMVSAISTTKEGIVGGDNVVGQHAGERTAVSQKTSAPATPDFEQQLVLHMSLSSSLPLEGLVDAMSMREIPVTWDYSDDLARQEITLSCPVDVSVLTEIADEVIANRGEFVGGNISWQPGYRGFVQLIVLIALSELMQEREYSEDV